MMLNIFFYGVFLRKRKNIFFFYRFCHFFHIYLICLIFLFEEVIIYEILFNKLFLIQNLSCQLRLTYYNII